MTRFALSSLVLTLTASLTAQGCPDRLLGNPVGTGDDVLLPIQSIGFAFPFAGATYTDVHISTNGFFYLSTAGVPAPGTEVARQRAGETSTSLQGPNQSQDSRSI